MKYEITVFKNGKETENYIADEFETITPRGRLGHTIKSNERKISEIKIRPEGKKRNKCYDRFHHTVIIKEAETGRRIFAMVENLY